MKASEQKTLSLEVKTADETAEVFIIDGRFKMVERGRGQSNTFSLPPGIYTVKVRVGFESREEHVVLLDKPERVEFERIHFPSAAPLADTGKTHEYHISAAVNECKRTHFTAGSGSSIFVFVRDWTSQEKADAGGEPSRKPQKGLKLLDAQGKVVLDLEKKSVFEENSEFYEKHDPWAACNVQVNPGIYRLALELGSGKQVEQTVIASSGWQTQVFLLQRNYEDCNNRGVFDRRADLPGASILLSKNGFNPADPFKRLVETARLGLVNTRQVLSENVIDEILKGKFENPMLGIFGAHLLLLDKQIKLGLLEVVVKNLRRMLGENQHPDVEALALRLGAKNTTYIFEHPPMLRRSWWQVVEATVDNEKLVPLNSMAAMCADSIWGEEPWLQWTAKEQAPMDAVMDNAQAAMAYEVSGGYEAIEAHLQQLDLQGGNAFALAMEDQSSSPARSTKDPYFKEKKILGGAKSLKTKSVTAAKTKAKVRKPKTKLNKNELKLIVKSSGLPRGNVQNLFNQYQQYKSDAMTAAGAAAQDAKVEGDE